MSKQKAWNHSQKHLAKEKKKTKKEIRIGQVQLKLKNDSNDKEKGSNESLKEIIKKECDKVGSQCAQVNKPPNPKKFELPQPRPSITILESPTNS